MIIDRYNYYSYPYRYPFDYLDYINPWPRRYWPDRVWPHRPVLIPTVIRTTKDSADKANDQKPPMDANSEEAKIFGRDKEVKEKIKTIEELLEEIKSDLYVTQLADAKEARQRREREGVDNCR